jgi:hypothetical protein
MSFRLTVELYDSFHRSHEHKCLPFPVKLNYTPNFILYWLYRKYYTETLNYWCTIPKGLWACGSEGRKYDTLMYHINTKLPIVIIEHIFKFIRFNKNEELVLYASSFNILRIYNGVTGLRYSN